MSTSLVSDAPPLDSQEQAAAARLDEQSWSAAIHRFCQATGLTASLYDAEGRRRAGPFFCTDLSGFLAAAGFWVDGGRGASAERALAEQALQEGTRQTLRFEGTLRVDALPLMLRGEPAGVIVFGWVFDHFADPVECERFGRAIGVAGHKLWSVVRLQRPTSGNSFTTASDLLETLATSILRQLEAIDRLQEVARIRESFLANVSHELRTPLQSIRLRVEQLLRTRLDDPVNIRRLLEAVRRSVDAEARLVEDLLDSARTTTGNLRLERAPVRLAAVVAEALEASEPSAAAKGISLEASLPPVFDAELVGDAARLRQVLWNLLSNALKFTPEGGTVRLSVRETPGEVELRVIDTGIGIAKQFLSQLFEPFAQGQAANGRQSGLGLGLSIARNIVELHGGSIRATSDGPGTGATFIVVLPRRA